MEAGSAAPGGPARLFVLSPASLEGVRGRRILSGEARGDVSEALAGGAALPLGDVYASISTLYFAGKRDYALRFARGRADVPTVFVITPCRGLLPVDAPVDLDTLGAFARTRIDPEEPSYLGPLERTARAWVESMGESAEVVLLGSVASPKYVEPLVEVLAGHLLFPRSFVGRGSMSRGSLLRRAVASGRELEYVPALSTARRGPRPPPRPPLPRP